MLFLAAPVKLITMVTVGNHNVHSFGGFCTKERAFKAIARVIVCTADIPLLTA
jgi:hypothetical protein